MASIKQTYYNVVLVHISFFKFALHWCKMCIAIIKASSFLCTLCQCVYGEKNDSVPLNIAKYTLHIPVILQYMYVCQAGEKVNRVALFSPPHFCVNLYIRKLACNDNL